MLTIFYEQNFSVTRDRAGHTILEECLQFFISKILLSPEAEYTFLEGCLQKGLQKLVPPEAGYTILEEHLQFFMSKILASPKAGHTIFVMNVYNFS